MRSGGGDAPPISEGTLRLFRIYGRYYLRRHFHAVRVLQTCAAARVDGWPLLVCLNHPSWWDPMIALALSDHEPFAGHRHYAPIFDAALAKYRFFEKIGFFGIDPASLAGARRFLQIGGAVLSTPGGVLWVTAQGTFADARLRPIALAGGIGHLMHSLRRVAVLPLALEYPFWDERLPEALVHWGAPILVEEGHALPASAWTERVTAALTATCDELAAAVILRRPEAFRVVLRGAAGIGGVYDLWRSAVARVRGGAFRPQHGEEDF